MTDAQTTTEPVALPSRVTPPPVRRPGRPKASTNRPPIGLTTKVEAGLRCMVFDGMTRAEAAKAVGLADTSLRLAFRNPVVLKAHKAMLDVLRTSESARNLHTAIEIRDDGALKGTAAGGKTRIEAARYIDGEKAGGNVTVNVGVNVQPGYQIATTPLTDAERQMLKLSGSHANVLEMQADVPTDDVGTPE